MDTRLSGHFAFLHARSRHTSSKAVPAFHVLHEQHTDRWTSQGPEAVRRSGSATLYW